jgi:hypothetical protein
MHAQLSELACQSFHHQQRYLKKTKNETTEDYSKFLLSQGEKEQLKSVGRPES